MNSNLFQNALQQLMQPEALGAPKPSTPGIDAGSSQNLVVSSRSQTGFTGVTLHKRTQRYEAHIWAEKKQIYLGSYNIKSQAARVHDIMALKIGKAGAVGGESGSTSGANSSGGEINYPLEDYKDVQPLLSSISQHDLVVTLRNYGKSLNASGQTNTASTSAAPDASTITPNAPPPLAPRIPMNLPPQYYNQPYANPLSLTRAASMPDDRRLRKRKQERPSSALDNFDNASWYPPEEQQQVHLAGIGGGGGGGGGVGFLHRGFSPALPPSNLPRPKKLLSGSGGISGAPLPLFQVARQQQQHQQQEKLKLDLASGCGDLPHPPPLQLEPLGGPQQRHYEQTPAISAPAVLGVTTHRFARTSRKRENEA